MLTIHTTAFISDGHEFIHTSLTTDSTGDALLVRSMRGAGTDDREVIVEHLRALTQHIRARGLTTDLT